MRSPNATAHSATVCLSALVLGGALPSAIAAEGDVLRVARSSDGLRFTPDAEPFAEGGSSPDVERLADGELIAVYDAPTNDAKEPPSRLTLVRSKDDGRSWSKPKPIDLDDSTLARRWARNGDLVVESDGTLRLYFMVSPRHSSKGPSNTSVVIRSATSSDGVRFRLDRQVAMRCRGIIEPTLCLVRDDERRVMLVSEAAPPPKKIEDDGAFAVRRAVSREAGRFVMTAPIELDENVRMTSVIPLDKGFRAYGWTDDGIVSLRSDDLKKWDIEDSVRLATGWDPAVVRLKNGTYLKIYYTGPRPGASATTPADQTAAIENPDGLPGDADGLALVEEPDAPWEDAEPDIEGLAPQPDFAEPVDYAKWYRENLLEPTDDNAYDAYVSFMPRIDENGVPDREDWPKFDDMYNGGDHQGPPKPWKPEDQPGWEETHKNVKEVLGKFREANQRTGFARRVDPTPDSNPTGPSEDRLLLNLGFPELGPHRTLAKATLADSWRVAKDGKVDAGQMIDAWKTVLRGAEHMERGSTLIENLVGIAERVHVESNARWALKQGVFGEKELEQAFDTLRQYDRDSTDVAKGILGEHAMALDTTQYLFAPPDANGGPVINPDRVERLRDLMGDQSETSPEDIAGMGPDDARSTVDAFNRYYREMAEQMRIGYPEVRAADLDALADQYLETSPITKILLPSLSRLHHLRARSQATRRATQLSYAVHIHHARTGQWPKSLDELPKEFGEEIRTDPFTGRPFGYRVGHDGPTIYSASENGIDDGGAHDPRWGSADDDIESDDHILWPPQE